MARSIRHWGGHPGGRRRHEEPQPFPRTWPARRHRAGARRRALATGGAFLLVLAAGLAAIQAMPTRYAATSVVSFVPRPTALTSADTVQLVGQKYVVLATSPVTLGAAETAVGAPAGTLTDTTTAVLGAGTGNVSVTVTLRDRSDAAAAANAVAGILVRAASGDSLVTGEQTVPAVPGAAERKPARMLLRSAATLAALLAGALVWTAFAERARPPETHQDGVAMVFP
jgi:hypothetical protein